MGRAAVGTKGEVNGGVCAPPLTFASAPARVEPFPHSLVVRHQNLAAVRLEDDGDDAGGEREGGSGSVTKKSGGPVACGPLLLAVDDAAAAVHRVRLCDMDAGVSGLARAARPPLSHAGVHAPCSAKWMPRPW